MRAVQKAERLLVEEPHNYEYLAIDGIPEFRKFVSLNCDFLSGNRLASELLFGKDNQATKEQRIATVQV
jgi:aspartate/tyrosine/aromatic aminotransferase